jgi:DNA-binding GntR family transcriptional regulator
MERREINEGGGAAQSERVYARLRRAIMSCEFLPDTRLKVMEIAAQERVSPGAVREALSRLSTEHLVVAKHQRGFRVSHLSVLDMADLYSTRAGLESDLVARSTMLAKPEWREALQRAHSALSADTTLPNAHGQGAVVHERFHFALVSGCDSPWSVRLFDTVYAASERYRSYAYRYLTRNRNAAAEHDAIFAAAMGGKADEARSLVLKHTMLTRKLLLSALTKIEQLL